MTKTMMTGDPIVLEVLEEVRGQDRKVAGDPPELWAPHRNGVRLHLSALEDEVREAREAWDGEKKPAGEADPSRWPETRAELIQVAAVALRAVRELTPHLPTGVAGSRDAQQRDEAPAYPAELLDEMAIALALATVWSASGFSGTEDRQRAASVLDSYSQEVGRMNVPASVAAAIAKLA